MTTRADEFAHFNHNILEQLDNLSIPVEQREMFAKIYASNHRESIDKFGGQNSDGFISGHELRYMVSKEEQVGDYLPFDRAIDKIDLGETLLHFPYDSFTELILSIGRHAHEIRQIVLSVYRLADDSQLIRLLTYLLQVGVKVTIIFEINAKGNEESNINYAHELKALGAQVIVPDSVKKNHAKFIYLDMVDQDPIAMVMTGNLNEATANIYEDYCLITRDRTVTMPMREAIMQIITGMSSIPPKSKTIFFTQNDAVVTLVKLIKEQAELGEEGRIVIKCNLFTDPTFMGLIEYAAEKGCQVDLIVRGECCWKPRRANITVHRFLHKYLEHSRVYLFGRDDPTVFIGSLDLATHKLFGRFEVICRVKDNAMIGRITDVIETMLVDDSERHYILHSDNDHHRYIRREKR